VDEPADPARNEHQRDRDRIVHSGAFRRLVYKTQVFVNHEGDLFRTRLTHSLEVAQIARSAARSLALNEDLVEAIALAHDLGHTPFGHAGQEALHACMAEHGGFEHNLQSLRVVDRLEQRYFAFDGLNLSFETREGILKHCAHRHAERLLAREPDGPARRFVEGTQPSLEAQLVNLCDEVAYGAHDIDDGLRSGLLELPALQTVALFARAYGDALARAPRGASPARVRFETVRRLLARLVADLVGNTRSAVEAAAPADADAARRSGPLVRLGAALQHETVELKRFLFRALYRHPDVVHNTTLARRVVSELFAIYRGRPAEMSPEFAAGGAHPRGVADYIAGMTDRFALREHRRLTGARLFDGA
jgi:dGTPase